MKMTSFEPVLTVLLLKITNMQEDFTKEKVIALIKQLLAGTPPETLLGPAEQELLQSMEQECVVVDPSTQECVQGVSTSASVIARRDM